MNKTGVNIIGGFLGSGKTTLLRHFLSSPKLPEKVALMINEIGDVVIDAKILKQLNSGVVELPNGCVCCTVTGDFIQALLDLNKNFSPDRILIEPTGIAEPGRILSALYRPPLSDSFRVEPTVIVLDPGAFKKIYKEVAYLYVMQIKTADIILFNKTDLADKKTLDEVEREVKKLNPHAFILRTSYCKVDLLNLLEGRPVSALLPSAENKKRNPFLFESKTFESPEIFSKVKLEKFLKRLPENIFRVKGFVLLPEGFHLLNVVGGQIEWEPIHFEGNGEETRLTWIGKKINWEKILSGLRQCKLPQKGASNGKNSSQKPTVLIH